jgi:hypothetical protein
VHQLLYGHIMDTQQMMELLLAMREGMKASNANTETMNEMKYETKQEIRAGQEKIQENLKRTMEEMMNTNQAKRDVKLEEFSEAIEETHVEREKSTSADMNACQGTTACQDAMEANLVKMERSPGEKEAAVELQETPNEDVAIYSLRECLRDDGLPRNDGGTSGMRETNPSGHGI